MFAVPLATLQSLQAGQGIPTGTPGHLLVKTETGQYQILRVVCHMFNNELIHLIHVHVH